MKKLKLKLQNFTGTEMLTREQLKTVMGGSDNGGSGTKCSTGPCTLTIQGSNGAYTTLNGTCASGNDAGFDPFDLGRYCYCSTSIGHVPVTSNGGVSRCTL